VDIQNNKIITAALKENLDKTFLKICGLTYLEYSKLDGDEQRSIMEKYHQSRLNQKQYDVRMLLGEGEKVLIGEGEHSIFVEAGLTWEEEKRRLEDRIDDAIYSKPVAMIKKLVRRIKK